MCAAAAAAAVVVTLDAARECSESAKREQEREQEQELRLLTRKSCGLANSATQSVDVKLANNHRLRAARLILDGGARTRACALATRAHQIKEPAERALLT